MGPEYPDQLFAEALPLQLCCATKIWKRLPFSDMGVEEHGKCCYKAV